MSQGIQSNMPLLLTHTIQSICWAHIGSVSMSGLCQVYVSDRSVPGLCLLDIEPASIRHRSYVA